MSLNETPSGNRVHIGIFGKRNAGKSSIMNAITGQKMAIVSEQKGTTTDPVSKAMELLPLGPVVMIDTPGLDDEGELGTLRVEKAFQVLHKTDIALLVIDCKENVNHIERKLIRQLQERKIPFLIVVNKVEDYLSEKGFTAEFQEMKKQLEKQIDVPASQFLYVSAKEETNIHQLKEAIASLSPKEQEKPIVGDLIHAGDIVVLVVPVDSAAPKGRLILPQQQTIRDILDHHGMAVVTQVDQLAMTLDSIKGKPQLVITDSQAFQEVSQIVPENVLLTSFSILFARYKGELQEFASAATALDSLEDGDTVLISEGCTHHRQCDDIGTVKMPRWIKEYTKKDIRFAFTSGTEFPKDLSSYRLVVHCGGCTLNRQEMQHRIQAAGEQKVPMVNYGMAIAHMHGILKRSMECFEK